MATLGEVETALGVLAFGYLAGSGRAWRGFAKLTHRRQGRPCYGKK
ncbi:hypothetical protein [Methylomonas koyamae]|nr:hypothetical protein [Methylomonas koyamae]